METEHTLVVLVDRDEQFRGNIGGPEDLDFMDRGGAPARTAIMKRFADIPLQVKAGQHEIVVTFIERSRAASDEHISDFTPTRSFSFSIADRVPEVVGDIDVAQTKALVEKYFGTLKKGEAVPKITATTPKITEERRKAVPARVELPRVYMAWITPPFYKPGDADADAAAVAVASAWRRCTSRAVRRFHCTAAVSSAATPTATRLPMMAIASLPQRVMAFRCS